MPDPDSTDKIRIGSAWLRRTGLDGNPWLEAGRWIVTYGVIGHDEVVLERIDPTSQLAIVPAAKLRAGDGWEATDMGDDPEAIPSNSLLQAYLFLERMMFAFEVDGSELQYEAVRDAMDCLWRSMTQDEIKTLNDRRIGASDGSPKGSGA